MLKAEGRDWGCSWGHEACPETYFLFFPIPCHRNLGHDRMALIAKIGAKDIAQRVGAGIGS